ncbi:MAG TPA: hypothetical protein H9915_07240 [Candidatus Gemmiger faecigallinarum]|nr:hypothetical protein [Candidatus Gemmiger faecigallinarum]
MEYMPSLLPDIFFFLNYFRPKDAASAPSAPARGFPAAVWPACGAVRPAQAARTGPVRRDKSRRSVISAAGMPAAPDFFSPSVHVFSHPVPSCVPAMARRTVFSVFKITRRPASVNTRKKLPFSPVPPGILQNFARGIDKARRFVYDEGKQIFIF